MISRLKIRGLSRLIGLFLFSLTLPAAHADTIPVQSDFPLRWMIGAEIMPSAVLRTNKYMKGDNILQKKIKNNFSGSVRFGFKFNGNSLPGITYKDINQGIGVGVNTFFCNDLLGTPVSVFVSQGAPFIHFNRRLSLAYEWKFGAALGWKHSSDNSENIEAVSTSVTAQLGLGLKLAYRLDDLTSLAVGIEAAHFSNGNTSWPNPGINTLGLSLGVSYILDSHAKSAPTAKMSPVELPPLRPWNYDIMVYGAWRKRIVNVGIPPELQLSPGKFGVVGASFSALRILNRWVAVGPQLDLKWDESAALDSYWVDGSTGDNLRFERPPFAKQVSTGLSAHAELTAPIFTINAGLGFNFINPAGERRFYQMLTLKTFLTKMLYLNVGYQLGNFRDPENLMLGLGIRLR